MSRLILPSHSVDVTEEGRNREQARGVCILQFVMLVPGIPNPIQVQTDQPVPLEAMTMMIHGAALNAIKEAKAKEVADRLVPVNGHVN